MADKHYGVLNIALAVTMALYLVVILLHGHFGANVLCFPKLGCNAGFFGYDAFFEHFLCACVGTLLLVRFMKTHPHRSFLYNSFWKNIIVLIALTMLLGVAWELFEFSHDQIMLYAPPQRAIFFLTPDRRLQPSNIDTMGDLTFDLMGSSTALIVLSLIGRDLIKRV